MQNARDYLVLCFEEGNGSARRKTVFTAESSSSTRRDEIQTNVAGASPSLCSHRTEELNDIARTRN